MTLLTMRPTSSGASARGRQRGRGVHRPAVTADLEVQMWPRRQAGAADTADLGPGRDDIAAAQRRRFQVAVQRRDAGAVVDEDIEAVPVWAPGDRRPAGRRGADGGAGGRRPVDPPRESPPPPPPAPPPPPPHSAALPPA